MAEKIVEPERLIETETVVDDVEPEGTSLKGMWILKTLGWVLANSIEDLVGPLVLLCDQNYISIRENGQICASALEGLPEDFEPDDVSHVVVGKMLLPGIFCLQSAYMRYVSSDQIGHVTATREAIGPSERWTPMHLGAGRFSFKSVFDKFLSLHDREGLRADSGSIGDSEMFTVKCQAGEVWRRQRSKLSASNTRCSPVDLDLEATRKAHTFVPGKSRSKDIDEAITSGRVHEALLDRRVKEKHDKYC